MSKNQIAPVLILAGGLATRLGSLTKSTPKSLVKIHGIPFIDYQISLLKEQGVDEVYLCLGHLGIEIVEHIKQQKNYGIQIHYIFDEYKDLGTGSAILNALPQLPEKFFVLYGDSYLRQELKTLQNEFEKQDQVALLTVLENQGQWDQSNIEFKSGKVIEYNKGSPHKRMQYIDYGISLFKKSAFSIVDKSGGADLGSYFQLWASKGLLSGYEVFERFYEIGSYQGIEDFSQYICAKEKVVNE